GQQSFFITNPGIDQEHFHDHPIDWLRALMAAMNVPLPSTEPDLQLSTRVLTTVGEKFHSSPAPGPPSALAPRIQRRIGPTTLGANFCAACRRRAPCFWSAGRPTRRGQNNLSPLPALARLSMPALCH